MGKRIYRWTEELIEEICDDVSSGRSIRDIVKDKDMPSEPTIYRELARNEDFANRMAIARAAQQEYEADNVVEMADAATIEDWQLVKLRIWARQWRASKLAPKKYGDKTAIVGDKEADPINVSVTDRTLNNVAFLMRKAMEEGKI